MPGTTFIKFAPVFLLLLGNVAFATEHVAADGAQNTYCQQHGTSHHDASDKRDFLAEFDLNDTQKQDIAALIQLYQPRLAEIRKRGEKARRQLLATPPDADTYGLLTDEVAAEAARSASEVTVLLAELQANAYGLLNADQQNQFNELRDALIERLEQFEQKAAEARASGKRGADMEGFKKPGAHQHCACTCDAQTDG